MYLRELIKRSFMKKKQLWASYWDGITDEQHGEAYGAIFRLFGPEFITALILYSLPLIFDAKWIANLQSTATYATLNVTNTILHSIVKIAEALSVGAVVLTGYYNGLHEYTHAGRTLRDVFWLTIFVGGCIAAMLGLGAYWIYCWYGVPVKMVSIGIPFLRLRAVSIFFMFVYFAFVGFLRGIKNTHVPMYIFICGGVVFLAADYLFIHGYYGFPKLGFQGSALASVLQYGVMMALSMLYVLTSSATHQYRIELFAAIDNWQSVWRLICMSAPIILDKTVQAWSYIWLGVMIAPMGKYALASYGVIKDMERMAFVPAMAFAQVVTLLVSNAYSKKDWRGIKSTIKKLVFLSSIMVFTILIIFSYNPSFFISFFDQKAKFTGFAASAFPILSVLVFFDLLQLILSGALRGAGNVNVVMIVRLMVLILYFIPVSYIIAHWPMTNDLVKFILLYGSFYIGNGLMSIVYIWRFRGEAWKQCLRSNNG